MSNVKKTIVFVLMTLFFCSCVDDDRSNCQSRRPSIYFKYDYNKAGVDLLNEQARVLKLFVFNEASVLSDTFSVAISPEKKSVVWPITLSKGIYTVVALASDDFSSYALGKFVATEQNQFLEGLKMFDISLSDFRFRAKSVDTSEVIEPLNRIMWGKVDSLIVDPSMQHDYTISMMKNTNNISITLLGFDNTWKPILLGDNVRYTSKNEIPSDAMSRTYSLTVIENTIKYRARVLRLFTERELKLSFLDSHTSRVVKDVSFDILQLITQSPTYQTQEALDKEDQYDITITYDQNRDMVVSILINGWEVIPSTPNT